MPKHSKDAATPSRSDSAFDRAIGDIVAGRNSDPFAILGPHVIKGARDAGLAIRLFVPRTRAAWVLANGKATPLSPRGADGFFEAFFPGQNEVFPYRFRLENDQGVQYETEDPYRFGSCLGEWDLHLLGEGTHYRNFEKLGAHPIAHEGTHGVAFAVWAPNARRVSVVGDFNNWDGRQHPMRRHPGVGVWDLFIPGLGVGEKYKFELLSAAGAVLPLKADPYGFYFEVRPNTASIVYDLDAYCWGDQDWIQARGANPNRFLDHPIAIYEVHLGSWRRSPDDPEGMLSYRELAHQLADYVTELGFTHIELLPVSEHPFDGSWGYQTLGYFAPTSRHGTPDDFRYFVDHLHQRGIGVLVDWVPGHFPRDDHGLRLFDGTSLYEHADPRKGEQPDWGTLVFNYGRNEVANFLLGNALFWFEKFHIDGLRVDAVASMLYLDYGRRGGEWVPNPYGGNENLEAVDFLKRFNELVHGQFPGVLTIAEESTSWPAVSRPTYLGGLGFSMKWNMGWMNDTLRYMHRDPVFRKFHQNDLTFSLVYAFSENFVLPLSHDEVVHGKGSLLDKMPGDLHQHFANLRLLLGYMYAHPGKKLLFMGGEFGQWQEWRYYQSLDWHLLEHATHRGLQRFVGDLNRLLAAQPALHQIDFDWQGFQWVDLHDHENSMLAFLRKGREPGQELLAVCNFTPVPRQAYRVGVPALGFYREVLNSDSEIYGGQNTGNAGGVIASNLAWHNQPHSIEITVPGLAIVLFQLSPGGGSAPAP